jgi:hypothetical protein
MNKTRTKVAEPPKSYQYFRQLIDEQGISTYRFALTAQVSESCFSFWKNYGYIPKYSRMVQIVNALSTLTGKTVTVDDLYRMDTENGEGR